MSKIKIIIMFLLFTSINVSVHAQNEEQNTKEYLKGLIKMEESEIQDIQILDNTLIYDTKGNKLNPYKVFPLLRKKYRGTNFYKNKNGQFTLLEVEEIGLEKSIDSSKKKFEYNLSWDGSSSLIQINVKFPSFGKEKISFSHYPSPFDLSLNYIENFNVPGLNSKDVEVSKNDFVIHNSKKLDTIEINYTINGKNHADGNEVDLMSALMMNSNANVKPDYMQIIGRHFILETQDSELSDLEYSVSWQFPSHMTSFDVTSNRTISKRELTNTLYLCSPNLEIDTLKIKNIPHYLLSDKDKDIRNQEIIKNVVSELLPETMRFFDDYNFPYYFIRAQPTTAIPNQDIRMYGRESSLSAEAFENGFIGTSIGKLDTREVLSIIHESIHRWMISLGSNSFDHLWFNEGFTEYIMLYVGASSGYLNQEDYERQFNDQMINYYSDFKDYSAAERSNKYIKENMQKDQNLNMINYSKGFIFAFYLDNKIRLATNGNKTLRDLMLDYKMEKDVKDLPQGVNISLSDFEKLASKYISLKEVEDSVKKYMLDGHYIDFSKEKLFNGLILENKSVLNPRTELNDSVPHLKFKSEKDYENLFTF